MRALATAAACVAAVRLDARERVRTHNRARSGPPTAEEIFHHCDANKDDILEMEEAKTCAKNFLDAQIENEWPKDDAGKPVGVTLK